MSNKITHISLEAEFNNIFTSINKKNKKYFHLQTIKNFINHFEEITNENDQIWIFKNLMNYLESCKIYINAIDRNISRDLYMKYLDKVGDYYRANLNFTLFASLDILLVLFAALLFLFKIFFNWMDSITVTAFCFLVYFVYLMYKKKINRTFGFFH